MILKTLTLVNFRKFRHELIEFPDGVTGVVGLNGVGKSTIFEAIAWVLYGSVAARTSADQIKREGTEHSDPCRVELDFVFEENKYRVVREMTGKSLTASATATIDSKVAATGAETVTSYIQKKLGMDFKSFFTSIFAKQKELNALSTMVASERRPLILRMLGVDSLDEVIKDVKSDKREKESVIEKLSQGLIDETGNDKIVLYRDQIKALKTQKDENDYLIKQAKEHIRSLEKERKGLEKQCTTTKDAYEKIKDKKDALSEKKTLFEKKENLATEIKQLKNKATERQKTIEHYKKKLRSFKDLDASLQSTEHRLDELRKKTEEYVKKIEQKTTLVARLQEDITEIKSKKKNIEKIGPDAKCPTCERVLADQYAFLLKNFDKEQTKKEKDIDVFSKEIAAFEQQKNTFSREDQAFQKKKIYLQTQIREKEKIVTTIENIVREVEQEKNDFKKKQQEFTTLEKIEFDSKEFQKVTTQVQEYYTKYLSTLDMRDKKKDELSSSKLALERIESDKKLVLQKIETFEEKTTELEENKKKIKEDKIIAQHLAMLADVLSAFRTHLISRIRPTLSSYSSDFFERLTDSKYRELDLDENYNLMVYDNGNAYGIERFSGGEEDLANLCLRLAISEVITERAGGVFNFIILDEIFGSQDLFRRQNIMKALNGLSSKFRQIFLITHVDDMKDEMEHIIFVTEKEDGTSTITIE